MKKEFDAERAFDKMFEYMQEFRNEVNDRFDKEASRTDQRFDRIEHILDESAGDYKILIDENTANAHGITRIDDVLDDHETRIGQLENLELGSEAA